MDKVLKTEVVSLLKSMKDDTAKLKEQLIFTNGTGEFIYVVDVKTDRIVFVNKTLEALVGNVVGELCYKVFQDYHEHCLFCTNGIITKQVGTPYKWVHYNRKLDKYFFIIDVCKVYQDRLVRIEKAYEIDNTIAATIKTLKLEL